jgi:hypothetical protein
MDCGTNHRLAQPLPSSHEGLRKSQCLSAEFSAFGFHTPHDQKTLQKIEMFPDGLLEADSGRVGLRRFPQA